jgi:hypothetical protein
VIRQATIHLMVIVSVRQAAAKLLHKQERLSYREISAWLFEAGHINKHGDPASSIKSMLQS